MTFSDLYKNDIKMHQLRTQLNYLPSLLQPEANINIKEYFKVLHKQGTNEEGKFIKEVIVLAKKITPSSSIECRVRASVHLAKASEDISALDHEPAALGYRMLMLTILALM